MARGEDTSRSDYDFLANFAEGASLFDHAGLELALEDLLGAEVDVISRGGLRRRRRRAGGARRAVIVVDASAAVLGLLADGEARRRLGVEPLAAPHLVDAEVLHTLNRQARRGVIDAAGAERAWRTWQQLGLRRFPVVGMLDRMWQLRHNVTSYDATYIALAEELDCPLLTADARLANASGPLCSITIVRR